MYLMDYVMKKIIGSSKVISMVLALILTHPSYSQESKDYDVTNMDGVISALYASISGEKGEPRQWDMFSDLFAPDAKLIPTVKNQEGKVGYRYWTPDGYKEQAGSYLVENGFHEVEIYRVTEEYGPIMHIFSTYESRHSKNDAEPFSRGINSIQMLNDGVRWWILNIFWSSESPENPLPTKYLPH
jgi:hypothetical protein